MNPKINHVSLLYISIFYNIVVLTLYLLKYVMIMTPEWYKLKQSVFFDFIRFHTKRFDLNWKCSFLQLDVAVLVLHWLFQFCRHGWWLLICCILKIEEWKPWQWHFFRLELLMQRFLGWRNALLFGWLLELCILYWENITPYSDVHVMHAFSAVAISVQKLDDKFLVQQKL